LLHEAAEAFFALAQLLENVVAVRDVHADADHVRRHAFFGIEGLAVAGHPANRAVGPDDAEFQVEGRPAFDG
jgi:hypothetical protein